QTLRESCAEESRGDMVRTVVEARRRWNGLGRYGLRSRCGPYLCRNGQWRAMAGRAAAVERERQLVCVFDSRRQAGYRRVEVVLPARARRFLRLGRRAGIDTLRSDDQ